MCGTIQIVDVRVGDVCRGWRFHLKLVFALASISSQRDGESHQCLLTWSHQYRGTEGSSFRVRFFCLVLRVCLH